MESSVVPRMPSVLVQSDDDRYILLISAAGKWRKGRPESVGIRQKLIYFNSESRLYSTYIQSLTLTPSMENLHINFPTILKLVKGFHVINFYKLDYFNRSLEGLLKRLREINKIDIEERPKAPKRKLNKEPRAPEPDSRHRSQEDENLSFPNDESVGALQSPRRGNLDRARNEFPIPLELESFINPRKIKKFKLPSYRVNENEEEARLNALLNNLTGRDPHLMIEPEDIRIQRITETQFGDCNSQEQIEEILFETILEPNERAERTADHPSPLEFDDETRVRSYSSPSGSNLNIARDPPAALEWNLPPLENIEGRVIRRRKSAKRLQFEDEGKSTIKLNLPTRDAQQDYDMLHELSGEYRALVVKNKYSTDKGLAFIDQVHGFFWNKASAFKTHARSRNLPNREIILVEPQVAATEGIREPRNQTANPEVSRENDQISEMEIFPEKDMSAAPEPSQSVQPPDIPESVSISTRNEQVQEPQFKTFAQLYPPATISREEAAKAFRDMLSLQKQRKIRMVQHEPFGTIEIYTEVAPETRQ